MLGLIICDEIAALSGYQIRLYQVYIWYTVMVYMLLCAQVL